MALSTVLLATTTLAVTGITVQSASAVTTTTRLLANPGFESGTSSWSVDTPASVSIVTTGAHGGSAALQIADNSDSAGVSVRSGKVAVLPGEDLTAVAWARRVSGSGGHLYLEFWRADGSRTTPAESAPVSAATTWQTVTVAATVPDDAVTATVLAYGRQTEQATVQWDDVTLTSAPPPLRRVPNAGFEEKRETPRPTQWSWINASTANTLALSGTAHGGTLSAQITDDDGEQSAALLSRAVPVTAGESITAAGWAHSDSGTTGVQLYLEFRDAAGVRIAEHLINVASIGAWRRFHVTGVAPPQTTTTTVRLYSTLLGKGVTRWDDVTLRSGGDVAYNPVLGAGDEVLFAGDQRVESYSGAAHTVHAGAKAGIVMTGQPGKAWDANPRMEGTVLPGGDGEPAFKMWYTTTHGVGYATSQDGVTWSRDGRDGPVLQSHLAVGQAERATIHAGGVVENPAWKTDRTRPRYFMLHNNGHTKTHTYVSSQSADGINWTGVPGATPIVGFDVVNATWDPARQRYVAMIKRQDKPPYGPRTTWLSTSTDFANWSVPSPAFATDLLDDELITDPRVNVAPWAETYGMPAIRYGDQYLGVPQIFDITSSVSGASGDQGKDHGRAKLGLAASHDLLNWSRPDRDPLVAQGAKGQWDHGFQIPGSTFVTVRETDGSYRTRYYYGSFAGDHTCFTENFDKGECFTKYGSSSIGMVSWPAERLASFRASGAAVVTTRPLTPSGDRLLVNYAPGTSGALKVEVLDAAGTPIPGYTTAMATPVTTDARYPGVQVRWGTTDRLPTGTPIRLRFSFTGGDLYSFSVDK